MKTGENIPRVKIEEREFPIDSYAGTVFMEKRYVVVNAETGELLDDAQGYGYRTKEKANKAWWYKNQSAEERQKRNQEYYAVQQWCADNQDFIEEFFDATLRLEGGPTVQLLHQCLAESNLTAPVSDAKLFNIITGARKRPKRKAAAENQMSLFDD